MLYSSLTDLLFCQGLFYLPGQTENETEADKMRFLPELDEVRRIAAAGLYDVLPVSCEILSDFTTPIETM